MSNDPVNFDEQGAKRIVNATRLVENHLTPTQSPSGGQTGRDQFFVKLGTNISGNKWNATQVEWDGTDDLDTFAESEEWDADIPLYIVGGVDGEEGDILLAESIAADDDVLGTVWIALKTAGSGDGHTWAVLKTLVSGQTYTADIFNNPVTHSPAELIEADANVIAYKVLFGTLNIGDTFKVTEALGVKYIEPATWGG